MKLHIELPLIAMEGNSVDGFLKKNYYYTNNDKRSIGRIVDVSKLHDDAKMILSDGDMLPEIMYYWAALSMEIIVYAEKNNLNAYWLDVHNKKEYELTVYTISELMCNTFLWENNSLDLILMWGKLDTFNLFNPNINFDGFIIPLDSGLGLISSLNEDSYNTLSKFL